MKFPIQWTPSVEEWKMKIRTAPSGALVVLLAA